MVSHKDAWQLVQSGGPIDAMEFLRSLRLTAALPTRDTRSRLLLRDGLKALKQHWGTDLFNQRMAGVSFPSQAIAESTAVHQEGEFLTLGDRIVDATDPNVLLQMLREMGSRTQSPSTVVVGGSLSLMLESLIVRTTDDVYLVDEIPAGLRNEHALLEELAKRYGLKITHFQSHYLPSGWQHRLKSIGVFGRITAMRVDPIDVLVGKLFSRRTKDLDDNRQAWPLVDQAIFRRRLAAEGKSLSTDPDLVAAAQQNWYILTGEAELPM